MFLGKVVAIFPRYVTAKHYSICCTLYCTVYLFGSLPASKPTIFLLNPCWYCLIVTTWLLSSGYLITTDCSFCQLYRCCWKIWVLDTLLWPYVYFSQPVVCIRCAMAVSALRVFLGLVWFLPSSVVSFILPTGWQKHNHFRHQSVGSP